MDRAVCTHDNIIALMLILGPLSLCPTLLSMSTITSSSWSVSGLCPIMPCSGLVGGLSILSQSMSSSATFLHYNEKDSFHWWLFACCGLTLTPPLVLSWKCFLLFTSAAYIQMHFRPNCFMEANKINPDCTAPKGAVWFGTILFAI